MFISFDADPDGMEKIAESLRRALAEIDPSTLREDPGFWHSLLFDVAIGDYRADEGVKPVVGGTRRRRSGSPVMAADGSAG